MDRVGCRSLLFGVFSGPVIDVVSREIIALERSFRAATGGRTSIDTEFVGIGIPSDIGVIHRGNHEIAEGEPIQYF